MPKIVLLFAYLAASPSVSLHRDYKNGEILHYQMHGTNSNHGSTTRYQAQANGTVRSNSSGVFVVNYTWSDLTYNDHHIPLPSKAPVQQRLSLDPRFHLGIPDLTRTPPALIGPMLDLLTFYSDVQLIMRQPNLHHAGDHAYIKHPQPNSWADGVHTLIGEDAIDFHITLTTIDPAKNTATLTVQHVPPSQQHVRLPASWMHVPLGNTPNNWVQVTHSSSTYTAAVGHETFTDKIVLNLQNGEMLSASMDNPVEVLEKQCSDKALQVCTNPIHYPILRQVQINASESETAVHP